MNSAMNNSRLLRIQPEMAVGGFSAHDGTVEFYGRIRAILRPEMRVVDFGAGRGAWFEDETSSYRRNMRLLRGTVTEVIGCDVDAVVRGNRAVDTAMVIQSGEKLDLADASVDVVVSDYVFEHVPDPVWLARELTRILKPGGWICARTPTRYNYVSIAARLIANVRHARWVGFVQPGRKAEDVFPTVYQLNTRACIRRHFASALFEDHTYVYAFEPQYYFGSPVAYRLFRFLHWLLPATLHGNLYVFLRKR